MAGLSMPEARFAKKISFAVGGRRRARRPAVLRTAATGAARRSRRSRGACGPKPAPTAKAAGKKKSPGHSGQGTDNFA